MRATLVAARDERRFCSFHFPKCLQNILAATDLCRIGVRADQDEIVVHHGEALDAVTLSKKFLFRCARVNEYDVGVATSRKIERLPCPYGHDTHLDPCLLLESRKKMAEEPRLLGRRR